MKLIIFFALLINICLAKTLIRRSSIPLVMPNPSITKDSWKAASNFKTEIMDALFPIYLRFRGIEHVFYRKDWSIGTIFMKLAGENSYLDCLKDHEREYKRNVESLEALFQKAISSNNHVTLHFCELAYKNPFIF